MTKRTISLAIVAVLLLCGAVWARMTAVVVGQSNSSSVCTENLGSELAVTGNATDLGASEESDLDGWTQNTMNTWETVSTSQSGNYALHAVSVDSGDYFSRLFTTGFASGNLYKLSLYARHDGTGGNIGLYLSRVALGYDVVITPQGGLSSADTTYTNYIKYFYYNADMDVITGIERGDNSGGIFIDSISIKSATPCLGPELNVISDAASLGTNEGDVYANWTLTQSSGTAVMDSVTTEPQDGNYHLDFNANGAPEARFYRDVSGILTPGKRYIASWRMKHASGGSARCGFFETTGMSTSADACETILTTNFTSYATVGFSVVYSSTEHHYFGCIETSASNDARLYVDSLSFREVQ